MLATIRIIKIYNTLTHMYIWYAFYYYMYTTHVRHNHYLIVAVLLSPRSIHFQPLYFISPLKCQLSTDIVFYRRYRDRRGKFFLFIFFFFIESTEPSPRLTCAPVCDNNTSYCSTLRRAIKLCGRGPTSTWLSAVVHWHTSTTPRHM